MLTQPERERRDRDAGLTLERSEARRRWYLDNPDALARDLFRIEERDRLPLRNLNERSALTRKNIKIRSIQDTPRA